MRKLLSLLLCLSLFACIWGCDNKPGTADSNAETTAASATESVMTNEDLYQTVTAFADMYTKSFTAYVSNKMGKLDTNTLENIKNPAGKKCTAIFQCSEDKAFRTLVFEIKEGKNITYEEYDRFTDGSFLVTRSEYVDNKLSKTSEYWVADQKAFYLDHDNKTVVEKDISTLGIYDNFEIIEQIYGK